MGREVIWRCEQGCGTRSSRARLSRLASSRDSAESAATANLDFLLLLLSVSSAIKAPSELFSCDLLGDRRDPLPHPLSFSRGRYMPS